MKKSLEDEVREFSVEHLRRIQAIELLKAQAELNAAEVMVQRARTELRTQEMIQEHVRKLQAVAELPGINSSGIGRS